MRLTQKELEIIDKFLIRVPGLLKGQLEDAFFEPLPDDELALWNCESIEEDKLNNWTSLPILYVLDKEKEDD